MALLGSILVDNEMMQTVTKIVRSQDFYSSLHETIYLALYALHEAGKPLDKVALAEELRSRMMLDKIGRLAYLTSLMEAAVPSAASVQYYTEIVREKASARGIIHAGTRIQKMGYECEDDVAAALDEVRQIVTELREPAQSLATASGAWTVESAAEIYRDGVPPVAFDIATLMTREDPVLIFGPPGSLKSWIAMHAAKCSVTGSPFLGHYPVQQRSRALYLNFDSGPQAFRRRVSMAVGGLEQFFVASPERYDTSQLRTIFRQFEGAFVVVDCFADVYQGRRGDDPGETMRRFLRDLRALYQQHGCNGIIVDHPHRPKDGVPADYYGSVQKEATLRTMWLATRVETPGEPNVAKLRVSCRKMSETEPFAPFVAKVTFGGDAVRFELDAILSESDGSRVTGPTDAQQVANLLREMSAGLNRQSISAYLNWGRDRTLAAIDAAQSDVQAIGKAKARRYYHAVHAPTKLEKSSVPNDDLPDDSEPDAESTETNRPNRPTPLVGADDQGDSREAFGQGESPDGPDDSPNDSATALECTNPDEAIARPPTQPGGSMDGDNIL